MLRRGRCRAAEKQFQRGSERLVSQQLAPLHAAEDSNGRCRVQVGARAHLGGLLQAGPSPSRRGCRHAVRARSRWVTCPTESRLSCL